MGTFFRRTVAFCFVLAILTFLYLRYAIVLNVSADTPESNKKINVVVMNLSAVPATTSMEIEESIGKQEVAPYLSSRGYEVQNVFSIAKLMNEKQGGYRALIDAFGSEPERDSARILTVTLQALPGETPNTVSTAFALLDTHVSGILHARKMGVPAITKHIWGYEAPSEEAILQVSFQQFKSKLQDALDQYDQQFLHKLESHEYPPLQSL